MAVDKKISQLTSLVQGDVDAALDVLPIVDTGADETKKITVTALVGAGASAGLSSVDINGGTIDGTTIGASSAAAGTFTTLGATTGNITTVNATTVDTTNIEVTNIKAKDGTAAATIADSTGVVSITANPILSGGTANGVLYLNGSKVATSGSALTYSGGVFSVDDSSSSRVSLNGPSTASSYLVFKNTTSNLNVGYIGYEFANSLMPFSVGGAERMWLTSTGLGIGTASPATRLEVVGASAGSTVATFTSNETGSTTSLAVFQRSGGAVAAAVKYNASNSPLTIDFGTTTNHGLTFLTNNTERMRLDASGNLGIGTASPSARLDARTGTSPDLAAILVGLSGSNNYYTANTHVWQNGSSTDTMTLTSGNLGIGTTSPLDRLDVVSGSSTNRNRVRNSTSDEAFFLFQNSTTGTTTSSGLAVGIDSSENAYLYNYINSPLIFATNSTERARITAGGYFKASNTGTYQSATATYHELRNDANANTVRISNTIASGYTDAIAQITFTGYSPNTTNSWFLFCNDSTATRAEIRSNGGLANYQANNVDLSDARTKNSITPAVSMWDKVAALEIVTYKYNDQTHDDVNLGVIAQQVEAVDPVWVDPDGFGETPEDGVPLKTVYTKDITFAAIKALQEAMARIEQLEAKVAALEA